MVTILKMQQDIEMATVADGFNISLSTADCVRNMANDISSLYLPAAEDNPGLATLLKGLRSSDQLVSPHLLRPWSWMRTSWRAWRSSSSFGGVPWIVPLGRT